MRHRFSSPTLEVLEDRIVWAVGLKVQLADGLLTVTGTNRADIITIRQEGGRLSIDEADRDFAASRVRGIVVEARGGDDLVRVGKGFQDVFIDATLRGGQGGDFLVGGEGNDILQGDDGDDRLDGVSGNNLLFGGAGDDDLLTTGGANLLQGGDGNDFLKYGGEGTSTLEGGAGNDYLLTVSAAGGYLSGQDGDDTLSGAEGNDTLTGGAGDDSLYGLGGDDRLQGEAGNDVLQGNDGADLLEGGLGDDQLQSDAADSVLDDDGRDQLISIDALLEKSGGNKVGLKARLVGGALTIMGTDQGDSILVYQIRGRIEIVGISERFPAATVRRMVVLGGGGDDYIDLSFTATRGEEPILIPTRVLGGSGNDIIFGGEGPDQIRGEDGRDYLEGEMGADSLRGGDGEDTLHGEEGNDALFGQAGNDFLYGNDGDDVIDAGTGSDEAAGDRGDDTLRGQEGIDFLFGGEGQDVLAGGNDKDELSGEVGDDILRGQGGNDNLFGDEGADTLEGGPGKDYLVGTDGERDRLLGQEDNDFIEPDEDLDHVDGGEGDDEVESQTGNEPESEPVASQFDSGDLQTSPVASPPPVAREPAAIISVIAQPFNAALASGGAAAASGGGTPAPVDIVAPLVAPPPLPTLEATNPFNQGAGVVPDGIAVLEGRNLKAQSTELIDQPGGGVTPVPVLGGETRPAETTAQPTPEPPLMFGVIGLDGLLEGKPRLAVPRPPPPNRPSLNPGVLVVPLALANIEAVTRRRKRRR